MLRTCGGKFGTSVKVLGLVAIFSFLSLDVIAQVSSVNTFSIAPYSNVGDITTGPDGALWFTDCKQSSCGTFAIGRITTSGDVEEFPLSNLTAEAITTGSDGALWFTDGETNIGRICASTSSVGCPSIGYVTEYPTVTPNSGPNAIWPGPDGALWFIEAVTNQIGRICTTTIAPHCPAIGYITEYPITTASSGARNITAGPDGAMWFTEVNVNKIGRICVTVSLPNCPAGGKISEYQTPTPNSTPYDITAGPDGALWFTEGIGQIGRITVGGQIKEYPANRGYDGLSSITTGPDGRLWFISIYDNLSAWIGEMDTTGAFPNYYEIGGWPTALTTGPDGALWISLWYSTVGIEQAVLVPQQTTGTIQVTTNLPSAPFNIAGPASYTGTGTSFTQANVPVGTYTVTYGAVSGYIAPSPQTMTVSSGGQIDFSGIYGVIGVDVACAAGKLASSAKLNDLKSAGVRAVVANAWGGVPKTKECLEYLEDQLSNAVAAGFKIALYVALSFDHPDGIVEEDGKKQWSGGWQVDQALKSIEPEPANISFVAIDVEESSAGFGASMPPDRITRIQEAIGEVISANLKPVIYTDRSEWPTVTGIDGNTSSLFSMYPLWDSFNDFLPSLSLDGPYAPGCPAGGTGATHTWVDYGGWKRRVGKQYNIGCKRQGTSVGAADNLDLDVFDASLFGLP